MFSRRSGFEQRVFPEILRHPCNCRFISHSDNVKKKKGRYIDGDTQTLQDLILKIKTYEGAWVEQERALSLIKEYEAGGRWVNKHKIQNDKILVQ